MRDRSPLIVAVVLGAAVLQPVAAQDVVETAETPPSSQESAPVADAPPTEGPSEPPTSSASTVDQASSDGAALPAEVVPTIAVDHAPTAEESAESAEKPANRLIEEIVVTSQKREERLQDIPISIQAFSQEKLDVLCWRALKTDQLCSLKIDQGWRPRA